MTTNETVASVVRYYREKYPRSGRHLRPGHRDWKRIAARVLEGWTLDELCLAIDGNALDPWHQQCPSGHTVEYIFRNATKVEGFIKLAEQGSSFCKAHNDLMEWARETDARQNGIADGEPRALLPELQEAGAGPVEGDDR